MLYNLDSNSKKMRIAEKVAILYNKIKCTR